ncbi:type VI secretion system baseplate subunit TssG [Candidatus Venteria ishoeyi]|uniref:cAMP-activated global transcriptional regulator CRP n=1 Tax=Candidatus Venteria ishoeyi TaxID=1899563 RepID=A0A1H6FIP5_9GAMM|nr:type VI secretion system baseplate subunit TssG [Candidatus Venteria ishoeyi]SEH08925.1 cAMP-activated global transcriptional regulator CRP [Candidatus Venteria ishoeyi]
MPPLKRRITVLESLLKEAHRFEFYQAVRLLLQCAPAAHRPAQHNNPMQEAICFRSKVDIRFPATEIDEIEVPDAQDPNISDTRPQMQVNFMGLAGANGPLPTPYTELIMDRVWNKDTALKSFLDIFNHRLLSLQYRVRSTHRLGYGENTPWQSRFARFLFSLFGMGTEGLQQRMQTEDHALLHYAGILQHEPHSQVALEAMLSDYFRVKMKVLPFIGQWLELSEDACTHLGSAKGQQQSLGQGAALGSRVWDQQGKLLIQTEALDFQAFLNFLPIGWGFIPLCELTRFFIGPELDFDLEIRLKKAAVPACTLSHKKGARLSWTSWLKSADFQQNPQVTLRPKKLLKEKSETTIPLLAYLPQEAREMIHNHMQVHNLPMHTVVIQQGEQSHSLFLIRSGSVQVVRKTVEGQEKTLANLQAGDFFGEFSLLTDKPRMATVITTADTKLLELDKADVEWIIEKYPRIRQMLMSIYTHRNHYKV